jgi:hypothetical protein
MRGGDASCASHECGLARELKGKAGRALVTASGNAAEVFSEGTSGEGGTRLAGTVLEADAALPRARHMFH